MGESPSETDEALAARVQQGDERAFAEIMGRYEPKLLRYGRKFMSDSENILDAVQDVFIKVYQNIKSFDSSRRFSPWIYRVAHNIFVNALRKKTNEPITLLDFDTLIAHQIYEDPIQAEKEKAEISVLLSKGLEKLPATHREVLILHYLEDLSYQDIADILQVPMGTVGVRIHRARAALKKYFSPQSQL
jgi:RNA polymerase sigma-70 factor (ECF subfamily)